MDHHCEAESCKEEGLSTQVRPAIILEEYLIPAQDGEHGSSKAYARFGVGLVASKSATSSESLIGRVLPAKCRSVLSNLEHQKQFWGEMNQSDRAALKI